MRVALAAAAMVKGPIRTGAKTPTPEIIAASSMTRTMPPAPVSLRAGPGGLQPCRVSNCMTIPDSSVVTARPLPASHLVTPATPSAA